MQVTPTGHPRGRLVAARLQTRRQAQRRERAAAAGLTRRRVGGALAAQVLGCTVVAAERLFLPGSRELACDLWVHDGTDSCLLGVLLYIKLL